MQRFQRRLGVQEHCYRRVGLQERTSASRRGEQSEAEPREGPGHIAQGTSPGALRGSGAWVFTLYARFSSTARKKKKKTEADWHVQNETFHLEIQTFIILVVLMKNGGGVCFVFFPKRAIS